MDDETENDGITYLTCPWIYEVTSFARPSCAKREGGLVQRWALDEVAWGVRSERRGCALAAGAKSLDCWSCATRERAWTRVGEIISKFATAAGAVLICLRFVEYRPSLFGPLRYYLYYC